MIRRMGISGNAVPELTDEISEVLCFLQNLIFTYVWEPKNLSCEVQFTDLPPKAYSVSYSANLFATFSGIGKLDEMNDLKFSVLRAKLDIFLRNHTQLKTKDLFINIVIYTVMNDTNVYPNISANNATLPSLSQVSKGLDDNLPTFVAQMPKYDFSKIVLPKLVRDDIGRAMAIVKNRDLIYHQWGFEKVDPSSKAVLNFYGPPGTGKTMTAHAVAAELGVKILILNYADIESKYVGDAPKNLKHAFETAEKEGALLFFDEADSFLGKRITSVSSSSDQAVNSLRSQMLIFLENFNGAVIFCTNLIKNYDQAFQSRISAQVKFELPDIEQRVAIFEKTIPQAVPFEYNERLSHEKLLAMAEKAEGFSGREIKNTVLNALCDIASSGRTFATFDDFMKATLDMSEQLKRLREEVNSKKIDAEKLSEAVRSKLASGDFVVKNDTRK